jgi:hypothetical protein
MLGLLNGFRLCRAAGINPAIKADDVASEQGDNPGPTGDAGAQL